MKSMRLYVDNVSVYAVFGSASGLGLKKSTTFTQGYHKIVVVGWNNEGYAFTSPEVKIFAAPTDATHITSPTTSTAANDTVAVNAVARWDNKNISHMRAYVDNHDVYDATYPNKQHDHKSKFWAKHYLVVLAWDNSGSSIRKAEYFTTK